MLNQIYPEIQKRITEISALTFLIVIGSALAATQTGITGSSTEGDLAAEYRFDTGAGDTAYDTANSNDGTINGASWTEGRESKALKLDGSDDYIDLGSSGSINPNSITISSWLKPTSSVDGAWEAVITEAGTVGILDEKDDRGFVFSITTSDGSKYRVWARDQGSSDYKGEWTHVAGTYNSATGETRIYVDGQLRNREDNAASDAATAGSWQLGTDDQSNYWQGSIDSTKIYSEALNRSQIRSIYNSGSWRVGSSGETNKPSKILEMSFQHIQNGQVLDTSGNNNHGTINNGASQVGAVECQVGRCFRFDESGGGGNGQYVETDPASGLADDQITAMAWIKPKPSTDSRAPIIRVDQFYFQHYSDDRLASYWYGWNNEGYHTSPSGSVPTGEWSHVAVTWDDTDGVSFYVDGQLTNQISNTGPGDPNDWIRIGREGSNRRFNGKIDQAKVYNRALSSQEIWKQYTRGRDRESGMAGAAANWRLNSPGYGVVDSAGDNDGNLNTNLLDNSGFESGSDSTGNMDRLVTNYAGNSQVAQKETKSGDYSGKHVKTGEDDQWSAVVWDLNLESGKKYDFGAWYKCTGNVDNADFDVGIANGTGWNRVDYINLGDYTCDGKWRFASGESDPLPSGITDTNRVRFTWGYSTNSGTMYVDDMYLIEDDTDWTESSMKGMTLNFDGSGDHIQLDQQAVMQKEGSTLVWTMNPDDTSSTGLFTDDPTNVDNHIEVRSNKIFAETQTNCNYFDFGQYEKKTGWNNYAIVFEDSQAFLYENGRLLGEATRYGSNGCDGSSVNQIMSDMSFNYIGSKTGYNPAYDGEIGKVQLYPYPLNQQQIKQVGNNGGVSIGG